MNQKKGKLQGHEVIFALKLLLKLFCCFMFCELVPDFHFVTADLSDPFHWVYAVFV